MDVQNLEVGSDFDLLLTFLPKGWQSQAKSLGALRRCRGIKNAEMLLHYLLIHLAEGVSLRQTAVFGEEIGLPHLSSVAFMDRLRQSGEWFRWMNTSMLQAWLAPKPPTVLGIPRRIRLVDGTMIAEPGPTGSSWHVHYAVEVPSLVCDEIKITAPQGKGTGESFKLFSIAAGDLLIGDRVYGVRAGISHVVSHHGDVLVRFVWSNLLLEHIDGKPFDLLAHLKRLRTTEVGDWRVRIGGHKGPEIIGRVCAVRKSRVAAEYSREKVRREARREGVEVREETVEAAGFIFVFTTLSEGELSASQALELYRSRWQVELVFKRLKTLLGIGHLRKYDAEAARSWLQGKLFVALMIEQFRIHAETFSPWGYELPPEETA